MKVDGWQYASMFSSEFLVVVAAIIVAGFNMYFLKMAHGSDDSLTMALLRNHSAFNDQLVLHNNTVRTVVVRPGFVQQAYADEFSKTGDVTTDGTVNVYEDSVMVKYNPNSIQELVSKQVVIHTTEGGETISSIAQKYNVSVNSVKWSNNLSSDTIKPGWFLVIPPYNGIVYKITDSNTTVPDLAKLYNVSVDSIINGNGLGSPDQMPEVGQFLIIKDGKVTPPPAPKASAKPGAKTSVTATNRLVIGKGEAHSFPPGYCTYYAAKQYGGVKFGGNANKWLKNAKAMGYATGSTPRKGAIVQTTESRVGHVAYVTGVSADGSSFTVSEMNYAGWNKVSTRSLSTNSKVVIGFIY